MNNQIKSNIELAYARRRFLRHSAMALGGVALGVPALAVSKDCTLTQQEVLGPMYNYGAPLFQVKLAGDGEPGERLKLRGSVLSADCRTPLPRTVIEIWQANDAGQYDKKRPGDFLEPAPPFHLRGMLLTDANGRYEIETIVPGAYPVPPGLPGLEKYAGLTRARHIHIRILPFLHMALTTQLYFKGDPNLPGDPWGGHKPSLALDLKQDGRYMVGDFDFILGTGL